MFVAGDAGVIAVVLSSGNWWRWSTIINPRRACAARVIVVVLCVCVFVCPQLFSHYMLLGGLLAIPTASVLQGQDKNVAILLKPLHSGDMA